MKFQKKTVVVIRVNPRVKNLKMNGKDQLNLNLDVKWNEEFKKKFVKIY